MGRASPLAGRLSAPGVPGSPSELLALSFADFQSGRAVVAVLAEAEAALLPALRVGLAAVAVEVLSRSVALPVASRPERVVEVAVDVWPASTVESLRVRVALEGCDGGWYAAAA